MIRKSFSRVFFLPLPLKLLWILPLAAMASLFYLGVFLAAGAAFQGRQSSVQYYQSHAQIFTSLSRPSAPNDRQSWWLQPNLSVQQLELQEFVRGSTRRTKLPAFVTTLTERIPVDLILIEDGDERVFTPFMVPAAGLPFDAVSLGIGFSAKHAIDEGARLTLMVPALDAVFSNLAVARVYNIRDVYYQNFTVFMHQKTAEPFLNNAMRSYHLRFSASPFAEVLLSNVQPLVPNSRFVSGGDSLDYPLQMLTRLKDLFFYGLMVLNGLAGVLYAFAQYRYSVKMSPRFRAYNFIHGLGQPSLPGQRLWDFFSAGLFLGLCACLMAMVFENLPFEFLIFSPYAGLFSQFSLKVSQGIVPRTDYAFMAFGSAAGALAFTASACLSAALLYYFERRSRDLGPLTLVMILSFSLVYFFASPLLTAFYARQGRDQILKAHYFGEYSLKHKYHDQAQSIGASPPAFVLRPGIYSELNAAAVPYLVKLEAAGEIIQPVKINDDVTVTNHMSVNFLGLRGDALAEFQPLINLLESNQVIVGKNISTAFANQGLLNFKIHGESSNIMISLPISGNETFDIPYYNNCVFMNIDTLASYAGVPQGSISLFLTPDREALKYLPSPPNPNQIQSPFNQSKAPWTTMEKSLFFLEWVGFLLGIAALATLLCASFYASAVQRKEERLYAMFWMPGAMSFLPAYFGAALAALGGLTAAVFAMVPAQLSPVRIPTYLMLEPYLPAVALMKADGGTILLAFALTLTALAMGYGGAVWALRGFYRSILRNPGEILWD